ncbi:MAG: carbohydrate-binding domain-containing protein, partial [Clostridia bacterium]|nr:carbohydrate-binding domain-containing protein [Clostridia bacterium]
MKIKKLVSIVTLSAILIASIGIESYAEDITVRLDGQNVECAVPPRIENGRTMVPMRAIFEAFGMEVTWNNDEKSVTATNGEDTVKLTVGENVLYVNGEEITMDTAPYIADDTTLVPVRAVSEGLDAEVEWNDEKRRVEITTAEYAANKDAWKDNTGVINVTDMTVTGEGVSVEENVVRITAGGDFTVIGENDNVMIHVNTKYKVKLRLEGVKISNPSNPVIFFENSEKSLITISKGTENYITDGEEYALEAKAAVFSNDDIEIKGEGKLYVTSKAHHALASDDDIKIEEGTMVLVSEKKDGIHANNTIKITGGNISVTAFGDGIQSEEDVVIEGGNISVTTNGTVAQSSNNPWGGGMPQGGRGGRTRQNQADWDNGQAQSTGEMTPPEGMEGMTPPQGGMPT